MSYRTGTAGRCPLVPIVHFGFFLSLLREISLYRQSAVGEA
jgi:hypothetical protein